MSQTKAQLLDNIKDNVQIDAQKALRFADSDSSHYVAFKAPATVSSSVTWTLPSADGSANYVLATDGSGNLSWIADPAGQWVTSGSNIYFTGGNVGIGDSSPSNPLSVTGASAFNGDVTFTGASYNVTWDKSADDLIFNDNAKAAFGTSSDLTIYHNGTHSFLQHTYASGNFFIESAAHLSFKVATDETAILANANGAVELYHNNVKKIETSGTGATISGRLDVDGDLVTTGNIDLGDSSSGGNNRVVLGVGGDLQLWHDGSDSYLADEGTGNLNILSSKAQILNAAGNEAMAKFTADGAVQLYNNNVEMFYTSASGCHVGSPSAAAHLHFLDGGIVRLGASNDLELYHSGDWNYIKNNNSKNLAIQVKDGDENAIVALPDGAVQLYYNNVKSMHTVSGGIEIVGPEGGSGVIGISADEADDNADIWRLSASASASELYVQNYASGAYETSIKAVGNGTVEIYHNDTKRLETTSEGIKISGTDGTGSEIVGDVFFNNGSHAGKDLKWDQSEKRLRFDDDVYAAFGTGSDLQIRHDGSNAKILNSTGSLWLQSDNGIRFTDHGLNESMAAFYDDGAVELYYDGNKKFNTITDGAEFTGRWKCSGGSSIADQSCYLSAGSNNATQIGMFNGYGANQGFCFYNNGSGAYTSWGMISNGEYIYFKSASHNIGNETDLSSSWTIRFRFSTSGMITSASGYTGGFSSSTGDPTGTYTGITGVTNQQVSCNSYGYEVNVVNNISGSGHSAAVHQYRTMNSTEGTLQGDSSGLAISNNSDYRKKERITDLTGSLEVIDSLRPRQYYYRAGFGKPTRAFAGFIAHEVQSTDLPQLTTGVKDAVVTQADKDNGLYNIDNVGDPIYQTVAYGHNELITRLVGAVKELKAKVEALEGA